MPVKLSSFVIHPRCFRMQLLALFAFLWVGVLLPSASCQDGCANHGRDGVNGLPGRDGLPGAKGEKGAPGKKIMHTMFMISWKKTVKNSILYNCLVQRK